MLQCTGYFQSKVDTIPKYKVSILLAKTIKVKKTYFTVTSADLVAEKSSLLTKTSCLNGGKVKFYKQ